MQKLRDFIDRYDEYVRNFETIRNSTDVLPVSEEVIIEDLAPDLEIDDEVLEAGVKMGGYRLILEAEKCIDEKEHQFDFYFEGISRNLAKLVYGGMY